jgi:hypothetical protein
MAGPGKESYASPIAPEQERLVPVIWKVDGSKDVKANSTWVKPLRLRCSGETALHVRVLVASRFVGWTEEERGSSWGVAYLISWGHCPSTYLIVSGPSGVLRLAISSHQ